MLDFLGRTTNLEEFNRPAARAIRLLLTLRVAPTSIAIDRRLDMRIG